ncbi:hypothetical protein M0R45_007578 [Rubus argutus]|uniref:UBP-type domain-containing protein n=1 Tax=Rubus argutus TaxID=59490 RepID=A0AAW1XZJ9_RUBAR
MAMNADSNSGSSLKTWCDHLAFVSSDLSGFPNRDTPCKKCQHPNENWFCLSCKDVLCGRSVKGHFVEHYRQTKHCLALSCSIQLIMCLSCNAFLDDQVIPQLKLYFHPPSIHPQLDAQSFIAQDELALAKEGLCKIFDRGLQALADPKVQQEFLLYSSTLLSADLCPSELKDTLSSLRCNLSEETSAFIKAQDELKAASDLSASITQNKFVLRRVTSKYDEVKKEIVASDERIANFKAMIKEVEAQIKRLEACLATEESNRAKIDEVIDSIETQVTTVRDGLVSDLAQVSSMEGTTQAASQLVAQQQSAWDNLKTTFTQFA